MCPLLMVPYVAHSPHSSKGLLPLSVDAIPRLPSCAGPPDVLICSTASGLGAGGMADRLLVACVLWNRGVKAEYFPQDLWRKGREGGRVEMSVEDATRVCLAMGIPFLVMVKAHVLRDKRAVKLRAVREAGVSDATVPLLQLARHILDRIPSPGGGGFSGGGGGGSGEKGWPYHVDTSALDHGPAGYYQHSYNAHGGVGGGGVGGGIAGGGGGGGGVEVKLSYLDSKLSQYAPGADRRKAYKEMTALERRVRSHLERMVGHPFVGSGPQREAVVVLAVEMPYIVIRVFCTAYLRVGPEEALRDPWVSQHCGPYKKGLRSLADALEEEEKKQGRGIGQGRKGGGIAGGGGGGGNVYVYSVVEDCCDVVQLTGGRFDRRFEARGREKVK